MIDLLSQNPDHLRHLCHRLDLGTPAEEVTRVYGGFHHKVWRLETDHGSYAVKQLSADADCRDPETIHHYNVTEAVAEAFAAQGIPAVFALRSESHYLQLVDNSGYLVHPWCDARALKLAQISEKHALQIARILAKMHCGNIEVPGVKESRFDVHSKEKIIQLLNRAGEDNVQVAKALNKQLPHFLSIVDSHRTSLLALSKHLVISHGDLDQKNVLWDAQGRPALIDWESAHRLNPTFEIVLEALDWSGITSQFDRELFGKFISAYRQAGGVIEHDAVQASFDCVLGDWLDWLIYNLGRSIDMENAEGRRIGTEQVHFSLETILQLQHQIPGLLAMVTDQMEYHSAESSCLI